MKVLVSACFHQNCKYNGKNNITEKSADIIEYLRELDIDIIYACPEQVGGLPTPRIAAEINGSQVLMKTGENVTAQFLSGGKKILAQCKEAGIKLAILKEKSPSCGVNFVYNGNFENELIPGQGITTKLLQGEEIPVFSENDKQQIMEWLCKNVI